MIDTHSGCTNAKLRVQLPILGYTSESSSGSGGGGGDDGGASSQPDISITVHGETRVYKEGQALVFDDSYMHSVKHNGTSPRVVLLLDVWHPDLTAAAKAKIVETFDPLKAPGISFESYERDPANRSDPEVRLKYLFAGAAGAGKTKLMTRIGRGTYDDGYLVTIGVDFILKRVMYQGLPLCLQLWDTAGPERFRTITRSYVKNCAGIFMCIDLSDAAGMQHTARLVEEILQHSRVLHPPPEPGPEVMLVGLKSDLPRQVSQETAIAFAAHYHLTYMECSSRTNENVELVLGTMLQRTASRLANLKPPQPQSPRAETATAAASEKSIWKNCSIM